MARNRERGHQAQKRERVEQEVTALRREGRAWIYRAVLAILAAVPLAFLTWLLAAVLVAVAVWCVVEGVRRALRANALLEDGQEAVR